MSENTSHGVLQVGVAGVGVLGPGLSDWRTGQALLRGASAWRDAPTVLAPAARLPANERRRAGLVVKAAVLVADQACAMAGIDPAALATVFTSATGDAANCHALCEVLATPERLISPTRFTNSVHNAPAGYWHIAVGSRQASTSLAAYDASVSAGLLEAAAQCAAAQAPVLLVACDQPYPEPLHALRPIADVFACALVLVPLATNTTTNAVLTLTFEMTYRQSATTCRDTGLERLRQSVPAARALPLLAALAARADATITIDGLSGSSLRCHCRSTP